MSSTGIAPIRGGPTAATAASKAKASESKADLAAGKRKREALGEVTSLVTNNKGKGKATVGKEKEQESNGLKEKFDGVVIKTKTVSTTTLRQPTRTTASLLKRIPRTTVTAQTQVLEEVAEVRDDDAMAVDDQPAATLRLSNRSAGSSRRVPAKEQADDAETARVFKKRRTSSEAPISEAQMFEEELRQNSDAGAADLETFANEVREADPEGDEWDDLDAEDADDPLMVSEYVVEIFKYMKELEVCSPITYHVNF
jgi:G2/mitotic-specific cyclin 1/2